MIFRSMFREKALSVRASQDEADDRLQITAPHEWLLVAGLGAVLLLLLAYGVLVRVDRALTVDAVLTGPGDRLAVLADTSGVVVEVLAEVGDVVLPGQTLTRLRTTGTARPDADLPVDGASAAAASVRGGSAAGAPDAIARVATAEIATPWGGKLTTLGVTLGEPVSPGDLVARVLTLAPGEMAAVAFITHEQAVRLKPGMAAQVRLATHHPDIIGQVLPARVESVSAGVAAPPSWLTEFGLDPPAHAHLLRATLTEPAQTKIVDGAEASLRIVLGKSSFASLFLDPDLD